ncbi:MAG TPA: hypothetical protein VHP11_10285, partial [Tepidisphaeraceae bacterium]|nr:hypothetical protein [Tepidisphaeraceae bacterium]
SPRRGARVASIGRARPRMGGRGSRRAEIFGLTTARQEARPPFSDHTPTPNAHRYTPDAWLGLAPVDDPDPGQATTISSSIAYVWRAPWHADRSVLGATGSPGPAVCR